MSSRLSIANLLNGPQPEQDLLAEEVVLAPHLRKQPPPTPRYDPVHDLGNRARPPSPAPEDPVVDDTDINQVLSDFIDESPAPAPQPDAIDDEILSLLDPTPGPSAPAKKQAAQKKRAKVCSFSSPLLRIHMHLSLSPVPSPSNPNLPNPEQSPVRNRNLATRTATSSAPLPYPVNLPTSSQLPPVEPFQTPPLLLVPAPPLFCPQLLPTKPRNPNPNSQTRTMTRTSFIASATQSMTRTSLWLLATSTTSLISSRTRARALTRFQMRWMVSYSMYRHSGSSSRSHRSILLSAVHIQCASPF